MEQLLDQIRTWRRHLHAIPEIGFQEYKTSKYLYEELKKMGIPYWCSEKDSGIIAEIRGRYEGKTVALLFILIFIKKKHLLLEAISML